MLTRSEIEFEVVKIDSGGALSLSVKWVKSDSGGSLLKSHLVDVQDVGR